MCLPLLMLLVLHLILLLVLLLPLLLLLLLLLLLRLLLRLFSLSLLIAQNQHQRTGVPLYTYAAKAFLAPVGQQALPNAAAYTAAITPNPAARLIREAIQPTVSPSATCRNVPKK